MNKVFLITSLLLSLQSFVFAEDKQEEVSYSNDIRPIVQNFCTTCHAGDNPEGDFTLTSYKDVRYHVEQGDILYRIEDESDPMPERGLMPERLRKLFKLWAKGGYINKGSIKKESPMKYYTDFKAPEITPIDINKKGFDLLEKLQGHWVGKMNLMGRNIDWFAFDYRAISASHVHNIFEGGTMGNLFTSFFVTNFKGKRTIMARNGGILNGIYRTSYFVLDKVEEKRGGQYYRLVDAYGGDKIMSIEITFKAKTMEFKSYTSRFGLFEPSLHMSFTGKRRPTNLAKNAAQKHGFPKNIVELDLAKGLPTPNWGEEFPTITSASYMWQSKNFSLIELGKLAQDPFRIDHIPNLAQLKITVERNKLIKGKKLFFYLSEEPLTDQSGKFITEYGYIKESHANSILSFPEISAKQNDFTFTYLHPGDYYITIVADNGDYFPGAGDITHAQRKITIKANSKMAVEIKAVDVKN